MNILIQRLQETVDRIDQDIIDLTLARDHIEEYRQSLEDDVQVETIEPAKDLPTNPYIQKA